MVLLQPFRNPIPSESWVYYILTAPLADPPQATDDLALVQNGAIKRLPLSEYVNPTVIVIAVTSGASYQMTGAGNVVAIKKTVPSPTTIVLEASPADGRRFEVADWAGNASSDPITINGNGKLIQGSPTAFLISDWQSAILTYSATLGVWNLS